MAQIPATANPRIENSYNYEARRGRPMLFQVMKPDNFLAPLYTTCLALHVSPRSIEERMTKTKNVVMTYGGWVEYVWPDELGSLACESSTGAFFSPESGLTAGNERRGRSSKGGVSPGRKGTIAWERKEDFLELFRMNGCVFNSVGQPVIRGKIMCIYDRGIFIGHFTTFEENEDDSHPFSFELSWEFKIEHAIYRLPDTATTTSNPSGEAFENLFTKATPPGLGR